MPEETHAEGEPEGGSRRWFGKAVLLGAPIVAAGVLLNEQSASANTGDPWLAGGNTSAATDTLGTTNAQPLILVTGGVERMRVESGDGRIGIGLTTPSASTQLHVRSATKTFTARFDNSATNGVCVIGNATGPNGRGVTGQAAGTGGSAIAGYGLAPGTDVNGVYGESQVSSGRGVKGIATAAGGEGVRGESILSHGVHGVCIGQDHDQVAAVYGEATPFVGTGPQRPGHGVWGKSDGTGVFGIGYNGVQGESTAGGPFGFGVFGSNSSSGAGVAGTSQFGVGVKGNGATGVAGDSSDGTGVRGHSASSIGVAGASDAATGNGLLGSVGSPVLSAATNGVGAVGVSTLNDGVRGESTSAGSAGVHGRFFAAGAGYGVYGTAPSGPGRYAGYFAGDAQVTGTLSKGAGTFKIDHPQDPANKYLVHSFVESPEMKNVYDGVVFCDMNGEAVVEMPSYFEALNRTFRYQLTPIGASAPNLFIADEVGNGRFRIAGGLPGLKVSWQVTGVRQDAFAEANPIVVEPEKTADDRGLYLHPELFGFDDTQRIGLNLNTLTTTKGPNS
jgi:hypothetical protein